MGNVRVMNGTPPSFAEAPPYRGSTEKRSGGLDAIGGGGSDGKCMVDG
jgi:hypothetical protein